MTLGKKYNRVSDQIPIRQLNRPFSDLFSDALRQLDIALAEAAPPDLRNSASKSCILSCALALEAVANSLLNDLDYSKRLRDSADRFQPLEKFEFALYHISEKILDRGAPQVQAIAELFKLRNDFVHPKAVEVTGNLSVPSKLMEFEDEPWPTLKIPREPRRWIYEHAKAVVVATDRFLAYFLLDLSGFDQGRAMATLLPAIDAATGTQSVWVVDNHAVFKKTRDGKEVPFPYLDLDRDFDDYINDGYGTPKKPNKS